jgi:putative transposase
MDSQYRLHSHGGRLVVSGGGNGLVFPNDRRLFDGFAADQRMVLGALRMARFKCEPKPGCLHCSDRRRQYCSPDYWALIGEMKAISGMSRKGNYWDNAPIESWFNSMKNERVFHRRYESRNAVKADLFEYIHVLSASKEVLLGDNRQRRHAGLGYNTTNEVYSACHSPPKTGSVRATFASGKRG